MLFLHFCILYFMQNTGIFLHLIYMHKNITLFSSLLPVFLCYYTIESKNKFLFLYTLSFYELKKEIFYMKNNNTKKTEYITYSQKILERIKIELTRQKISQKTLAQLCNVSQPTISKLLKGDSPLTLEFIYKVSEKLDIPIETLLSTSDTLTDKLTEIQTNIQDEIYDNFHNDNEAIVSDPALYPFRGITGKYYFYCNPTISSESELLKGTLHLLPSERAGKSFCSCQLTLYTGKYDSEGKKEKKLYTGMMLISLPMQSCYCILSCDESAEYVFLLFHHMFLTKANLECRIAAVLTTSAGSYRRPTMEKCIISRTSLSSEDLSEIEGQLKMNCSNIQITEKDFQEHILKDFPEDFPRVNITHETIYSIEEAFIQKSSLPENTRTELINKLRKYSIDRRYTKISTHADDILYNFIIDKKRKKNVSSEDTSESKS